MKICLISDSHSKHLEITIPKCDILIHSGDWTNLGKKEEVRSFALWLEKQPAKHILLCPGNHEVEFEKNYPESRDWIWEYCPKADILINQSAEIGGIKFWASPYTPAFGFGWAYNAGRNPTEAAHIFKPFLGDLWANIPEDTNFLINHGMPLGILDEVLDYRTGKIQNVGDRELLNKIQTLKDLKYYVGGHLHLNGGKSTIINGVTYYNAAICNDAYQVTKNPIIFDY